MPTAFTRAVRFDRYGGPEVLYVADVPTPEPGPGEVLVRVRGGSETFLAWSEDPLPAGAPVLVIESRGCREVGVIEWVDPLDALGGDTADAS